MWVPLPSVLVHTKQAPACDLLVSAQVTMKVEIRRELFRHKHQLIFEVMDVLLGNCR